MEEALESIEPTASDGMLDGMAGMCRSVTSEGGARHMNVNECVVDKRVCTVHGRPARKKTEKKKVWTRNERSGLYQYRWKSISSWGCDKAELGPDKEFLPSLTNEGK